MKKSTWLTVFIIVVLSYVLIDIYLPARTFFPDEQRYVGEARSMAETGKFAVGTDRAWEMPLTGSLYSVFLRTFGEEYFIKGIRIFQSFILALTAIGGGILSWLFFKNKIAALAALIMTLLYPSLVAYHVMLLSELFFTCSLIWSFVFLRIWTEHRKIQWLILSVFVFSIAAYTRATLTFVVPIFVIAAAIEKTFDKKIFAYAFLSAVLFAAFLSPWWIRNYETFGKFIPFTTTASMNIYLGNNPANTTASIDWGETGADPKELAEIYALKDEVAISNAFAQKAKEYIIENPVTFMKNAWLKFKRFWNFTSNYDAPAEQSLFFKLYNLSLLVSWLPVFLLGMISFAVNWRMWRTLMPIYCLIAYYTFIHVVAIASLRYRLPIEPFFIVMASDAIRRIIDIVKPFFNKPISSTE